MGLEAIHCPVDKISSRKTLAVAKKFPSKENITLGQDCAWTVLQMFA